MSQLVQYSFRIPADLIDAVRKQTANVSEYIRSLIEDDLGQQTNTRDYPRTPYVYHARLIAVIDGDTLELDIDAGFEITLRVRVRLEQVNAPELDTAAGKRAKEFVEGKLKGTNLVIETKRRGKYGRYLGKIFYHRTRKDYREILQQGKLINDEIIQAGHGNAT